MWIDSALTLCGHTHCRLGKQLLSDNRVNSGKPKGYGLWQS